MKITILGGGSFGTAFANQISFNPHNEVTILLRDTEVRDEINNKHSNSKYFLNKDLNKSLKATTDYSIISDSDVLIYSIPANSIENTIEKVKKHLKDSTLIINVSKGIFDEGKTIVEYLQESLESQNVITLKGASFSAEMVNRIPTLLTVGFTLKKQLETVDKMLDNTNIFTDYTTDIKGVEILSAVKNIYAILLGNIDAKYNSANTRFLILTKAISEIKIILRKLGGREETIFLGCGVGDISLTSLNDLSRNRTLGLLIGKGFYNSSFNENSVVLEGIKTLKLIDSIITDDLQKRLPLLNKMIDLLVLQKKQTLSLNFKELLSKDYTTVITYGTFDLLHFGHLEILRRAKDLGDRLIVGLSTDEFNLEKGKVCEFSYERRKQFLESLSYVDLVIPESNWEQKTNDVISNDADIFVMGSDWEGKFDFLKEHCEVRYFPRTKGVSTTELKKIIKKQ